MQLYIQQLTSTWPSFPFLLIKSNNLGQPIGMFVEVIFQRRMFCLTSLTCSASVSGPQKGIFSYEVQFQIPSKA